LNRVQLNANHGLLRLLLCEGGIFVGVGFEGGAGVFVGDGVGVILSKQIKK